MKPPGWLVLQKPYKGTLAPDGKSVVFTFKVRWWHPGLWIELAKRRFR